MEKITVPFNDNKPEEIESSGVFMTISWDSLTEQIGKSVRLRPDEIIDGLVITDTDIKVKISRKKGRKIKKIHK